MAHGFLCTCKKCNPSIFDSLFGSTKKGPFYNSGTSGSKTRPSPKYGARQTYYGGKGRPDGPGHGHYNPNNGFNRPPVSDFLGNKAIRGAGGSMSRKRDTPK